MQPIARYSLTPHGGAYATWPEGSVLEVDGRPCGTRVPGYLIEAQYQTPDRALLVTSFDCPYEEANVFVLLDAEHGVRTRRQTGPSAVSWLLHSHWPEDDRTLVLHYHRDLFLRLRIQSPGGLRLRPRLTVSSVEDWATDRRMAASQAALRTRCADLASTQRLASSNP